MHSRTASVGNVLASLALFYRKNKQNKVTVTASTISERKYIICNVSDQGTAVCFLSSTSEK
jgi:hypothetical protein